MEPQIPESNREPQVATEIPSAVRSNSSWNTVMLLVFAGLGLLVLLMLKGSGRTRKAVVTDVPMTAPDISPLIQPGSLMPPPVMAPSMTYERSEDESLRDIRRRSPILILNNTTSLNAGESGSASQGPDMPMPQGFRPTTAVGSHATTLGDREFIIAQGKLIDAVLETAISTDHPGMLRALVSDDIYGDSGRTVLLPRGSRLVGQYDSDVVQGQSRVFVIWQRVIRPDGVDITLDSGGTDALGRAGVDGKVNRHFFTMFGAATLLSMIGATAATVGVSPQDSANSLAAYRSSVAQGFNEASNSVLGVFVRIKPTVNVRQGTAVKVLVARDLRFDPALLSTHQIQVIP